MAQGSRQIQSQAQQQVQTLSPQQILVVKLLELPAVELEDRIASQIFGKYLRRTGDLCRYRIDRGGTGRSIEHLTGLRSGRYRCA